MLIVISIYAAYCWQVLDGAGTMTLAYAGCGPTRGGAPSLWPLSARTYMPLTGGLGGPEDEVAACEPRGRLMAAVHAGLGGMRPLTVIHAGRGGVVRCCHIASEIMDLNRALLGHCWTGEYGPTACGQHGCQLLAWLTSLRTQPAGSLMLGQRTTASCWQHDAWAGRFAAFVPTYTHGVPH